MNAKRRVAVFRSELLQPSETFIRDQVSALTVWEPVLVGRKEVEGGLPTPNIPREIVPESGNRLSRKFRFWLSRPDPMLVAKLQQLQVDLVHVHFGTDAADIWPSVKATGLPMVVTLHGYDININKNWWEAGHGGLRKRAYPRRLLEMSRSPMVNFLAVSKAIRQRGIAYGISEEKITVSYIGVDSERFKPGATSMHQRPKRILFVGRMVEKKAPLLLIQAFSEVRKRVPDSELVMIGDGPLLQKATILASALKNTPVKLLGACNTDEVLAQLHQARVLCLPSITAVNGDAEGFGMVILESQACGVPVITSARGGAQEGLLEGQTGFSFEPGSKEELVEGLIQILSNNTLNDNMSTSAARFTEEFFNIHHHTRKMETIYNKIAPKRLS